MLREIFAVAWSFVNLILFLAIGLATLGGGGMRGELRTAALVAMTAHVASVPFLIGVVKKWFAGAPAAAVNLFALCLLVAIEGEYFYRVGDNFFMAFLMALPFLVTTLLKIVYLLNALLIARQVAESAKNALRRLFRFLYGRYEAAMPRVEYAFILLNVLPFVGAFCASEEIATSGFILFLAAPTVLNLLFLLGRVGILPLRRLLIWADLVLFVLCLVSAASMGDIELLPLFLVPLSVAYLADAMLIFLQCDGFPLYGRTAE